MSHSLFSFIIFFIKKQKLGFFIIAISAIIASLINNALWPMGMGALIDTFNEIDSGGKKSFDLLFLPIMMMGGYWLMSIIAQTIKGFSLAIVSTKCCADIRKYLFDKIINHKHSYFINNHIGGIAQKISELPTNVQYIYDNVLTVFGPIIISIIFTSLIFYQVNYMLGIAFFCFLAIFIVIIIMMGRYAVKYADQHFESLANLSGVIIDIIKNHLNVRVFNGIQHEKKIIGMAQDTEVQKRRKAFFFLEKLKIALILCEIAGVTFVLWTGISLWEESIISLGELVFITNSVFNITGDLWFATDEITYTFRAIGVCKQSITTIVEENEKINEKIKDEKKKPDINVIKGEIAFRNVSFKYKNGDTVFNGKSLTINGYEKIGLVGFSGSGKTSFVNLIMRLYELDSGEILIDGQDIKKHSIISLRENIAFIQQEPMLFHRTIMDNIRYGKFSATDEEVIDASIKAHAHDFIKNMEEGYNTTTGEGGGKLSGGQKQRIAIARAFLKNAPILIMDEATSALDSLTENKIQESLHYLMQGKTVIVIAHRLSTILHMDRIIVFDKGKLIEQGSHNELMALNGHYKNLWDMQQDGVLPNERGD